MAMSDLGHIQSMVWQDIRKPRSHYWPELSNGDMHLQCLVLLHTKGYCCCVGCIPSIFQWHVSCSISSVVAWLHEAEGIAHQLLVVDKIDSCTHFDHPIKTFDYVFTDIDGISSGYVNVIIEYNLFTCKVDHTASLSTSTLTVMDLACLFGLREESHQ